ncbi:MAG TPA: hypothetical protein VE033_10305 [Acetobacteraceae bacterium]|nr:hypothetical protein [Acetobacteraceae bacterium]
MLLGPLPAREVDLASCALAAVGQQPDAPSFGWRVLVLPATAQGSCARTG